MIEWHDYLNGENPEKHTVTGTLRVWKDAFSPQLNNQRDIFVYLPPSYGQVGKRFPVLYMQDGQNLFDRATSFVDEWQVDETMETLAQTEGLEAIVVGIPNIAERRVHEYSPFAARMGGGQADLYLQFLIDTVKPVIDAHFLTHKSREFTGIVGSSLGGLLSTYAFFHRPDVFGFMGALSPAYWFAGQAIMPYLRRMPYIDGKIYLDVGTAEMGSSRGSSFFRQNAHEVYNLLLQKGYRSGVDLHYVEENQAAHNEAAWARRLPDAMRFLLGDGREFADSLRKQVI